MTVSLERIYPKNIQTDDAASLSALNLHLDRYHFAADNLNGDLILDIACGCGYGTALMAEHHPDKQFIGVDIDPEAISYASQHYQLTNLKYICSSAESFSHEKAFDTIVSLETIEHLAEPELFINILLDKLLINEGYIIASVPVTPTKDGNPHHLHDFSKNSFLQIFTNQHCSVLHSFEQIQPWFVKNTKSKSVNTVCDTGTIKIRMVIRNILLHYMKHPAALVKRGISIIKHGFCNKYLTVCFIKNTRID